jgi:signal transduction histidine kinase
MQGPWIGLRARVSHGIRSIRLRLFLLLAGLSLGIVVAANALWLPTTIREIQANQEELRQISVRSAHFQIDQFLQDLERSLDRAGLQVQVALMAHDRGTIRDIAQMLIQQRPAFEEVGVLDGAGRQILRESRRLMVSDAGSRESPFAAHARSQLTRVSWGDVVLSDTSEPWVTFAIQRSLGERARSFSVYGVVNLKPLTQQAEAFKLGNEGELKVVDRSGALIAARDPAMVSKRISLIDRPLIRALLTSGTVAPNEFVSGSYLDERGMEVAATGLRLAFTGWGVIVHQPRALLYAPIRQKIWHGMALSSLALALCLLMAHVISRLFTRPITRLQEGAQQIAAGQLEYRVAVETCDEIGHLAAQFNQMAGKLQESYREMERKIAERSREITSLYTALAPLAEIDSIQQLFQGVIERIATVTGADSALIRILDRETNSFVVIAQRKAFPADYVTRAQGFRPESAIAQVFSRGEPIIAEDIQADPRIKTKEQLRLGFNSCAFLPLVARGEVRGVIHLASKSHGFFKEDQTEYLMAIARLMGIVVENCELLQSSMHNARELRRSNQELEQFAYVASHDLQEPLRMIGGYTQLLAKRYRGKLDSDADEFINYAVDGAKRMQGLIEDLLAYSRVGTSGKPFAMVDCSAALTDVLDDLKTAIEEAGATVTQGPLATLPGDETQVRQLLQNLIANAIKYRDTRPPVIHVGCVRDGNRWRFCVKDNGIGINPQYAERIFVIFQRLHTQKQYSGNGIGLALCKKIVERHGGRIWVVSQPGQGSTFHFTLPAQE